MTAPAVALKPTHKSARAYYTALAQLANVGASHEGAVRSAFDKLIETVASPLGWTLVANYSISRKGQPVIIPDGVLLDAYRRPHGYLEAKDDADDLAVEMRAKLKLGYPASNILFWQPRRAILVQNGAAVLDYYLDTIPRQLCKILVHFFNHPATLIAAKL